MGYRYNRVLDPRAQVTVMTQLYIRGTGKKMLVSRGHCDVLSREYVF